jgi:hypothetical protein
VKTLIKEIDLTPKQPKSISREVIKPAWQKPHESYQPTIINVESRQAEVIVIRVQKEFAVEAMKIAIKSGNKKIRIEII